MSKYLQERPGKVKKVMGEYKKGNLKSSSGQTVTNPKQAVAIALSEARKKSKKSNLQERGNA